MRLLLPILLTLITTNVLANLPDQYQPLVIEAPFSFSERVFDLSSAVDRAKHEQKPLYIYLGAADCPPCRVYQAFLLAHQRELKGTFDSVLLVDMRTWLKGPKIVLKIGDRHFSINEFKALIGDSNDSFSYPYFWYISPDLRQVKQLPRGSSFYTSVERQIELLRIP